MTARSRDRIRTIEGIPAQRWLRDRLAAQQAATNVLTSATSLAEAAPGILRALCETLGWAWGGLWLVSGDRLRFDCCWHVPTVALPELEVASRSALVSRGDGLAGRSWATGLPLWIADTLHADDLIRPRQRGAGGLRASIAVPVAIDDDVLGVMEFFGFNARPIDTGMLAMMRWIGTQLGQFIRRAERALADRKARGDAEAEATRIAFLENAGALLAGSDDFDAMLELVPQLAVPALADVCVLDQVDATGRSLRRVSYVGQPDVAPPRLTPSPDAILRLPFPEVGRTMASVTFTRSRRRPPFDAEDRRLAEEYVRRAALAIERVRRHLEIEEAIRIRDSFLGIVTHDLTNPLHVIELNAELLDDQLEGSALAPGIRRIRRASRRMRSMLRELVDVAQLQAGGKLQLERSRLDLGRLVAEQVEALQSDWPDRVLQLTVEPGDLTAFLDRSRIERVVANLLTHALRHSQPGAEIPVAMGMATDAVQACLRIGAPGWELPPEGLPRAVAAPDRPGDRRARRAADGVRLANSGQIVAQHGGSFRVETTDGGSIFTVCLPLPGPTYASGAAQ